MHTKPCLPLLTSTCFFMLIFCLEKEAHRFCRYHTNPMSKGRP